MNVGDYVRNNKGNIAKIIEVERENNWLTVRYDKVFNHATGITYNLIHFKNEEEILEYSHTKSSPNILDILEPMDLLYIDISPDDCGGIVVPRIPETLDELERYIKKIKSGEYILKYVVTHEQLENSMYEVGE